MTCFKPLLAFRTDGGQIVFSDPAGIHRELNLPCGRCIGCRLRRQRDWSIRCMHEAQVSQDSCFVTLTYDDRFVGASLDYKGEAGFQKFMKRLRWHYSDCKIRYFVAGEYGSDKSRPHFHALLFANARDPEKTAVLFEDRKRFSKDLDRSKILEMLWPFGYSSIGNVTFESAAYVAKYCTKKVTGKRAARHYEMLDLDTGEITERAPEFAHMSLKPGIGFPWFEKYWQEVFVPRDGVVQKGGYVVPSPKYYDKCLERLRFDIATDKEFDRAVRSKQFESECTPERLGVREMVAAARLKTKQRKL